MKLALTPSNSVKIVLALLALAGCSAEASMPAPDNSHGNNKGNTLNMAGSSNLPNGNGGSGNLPSGNGGTSNVTPNGGQGTSGSGTSGGPATGTGGGGALSACPAPPAAGAIADLLIDDMEDGDNGVAKVGNRTGFWYTYLDAFGSTIVPAPDATGAAPLKPGTMDCHGGMGCVKVSGSTMAADTEAEKYPYAGVGFDFSNAKKPCVYNGGAYTGIKFWAMGDTQIRVKVNTSGTADATGGGTCTTGCSNGHGVDVVLSPTWAEVDLPFATLMQDPTWGTQVPFDKSQLLSVQVQFPSGVTFSAALDDFTFY